MARLSEKQANLIYFNATHLGLTNEEERALVRLRYTDMSIDDIPQLIDLVLQHSRMTTPEGKEFVSEEISKIIERYKSDALLID